MSFKKLFCPECKADEKISIKSRYGGDYPYILNCSNCGKFEIDKLKGIKNE